LPLSEVDAVIDRLLAVSRTGGVAAGIGSSTPDQLRHRRSQGFTLLSYAPDYLMLANAAREGIAGLRGQEGK
jgi:hypothetical protein